MKSDFCPVYWGSIHEIRIGQLNPTESNNETGSVSSINFTGSEKTVERGSFTTTLIASEGLNDENKPSMSDFKFTKGTKTGERVEISETEANGLVRMEDNVITIDAGLSGKEFVKTVAHEMGHGAFTLLNKAKAFFLPSTKAKGHEPGNPNGEAANAAENQCNSHCSKKIFGININKIF